MRRAIFTIALGFSLSFSPSLIAQRGIELHGTPASVTSPTVDGRLRGIPGSVTDPRARSISAGHRDHDRGRHHDHRDVRQLYAVPYYGYYGPLDAYSDYDQSDQSQQQAQQPAQPAEDEEQAAQPEDSSRYGTHSFNGRDTRQLDEDRVVAQAQPAPAPAPAPDEPMTTLVYRDGHKSEIRNYAIVGNNLIDLSRSPVLKKIPLDSLDLAATSKENEANGVDFHAP